MSLTMFFDKVTVGEMMTTWPTTPALHQLPDDSCVLRTINADLINGYLHTGTAPAEQLIVIKGGAALHTRAYTTNGYADPDKIAKWRGRGYTVQLRNLNRWCPAVHAICWAIQDETGYGCYASGFVTPGGGQGLYHHWDQNLGLIYQMAGHKTWQIWQPEVEEPHDTHFASNTSPGSDVIDRLKSRRPDFEFDLGPGQVLVLPRGWMHNPHARGQTQDSVHVTFVARELTGFWIAGKLTQAALTSTPLRQAIPPAGVVDAAAFAVQVARARDLLTQWLAGADVDALAAALLQAARTEPNADYVSDAPPPRSTGRHPSAR
ncbi:cupin domain-containing protein [Micromonospora sp. WMMD980]|uniref:JmjC domain-containing protein n=1 Tax=Micromonospora sp. WMMD980 TaxID=3016088 RepID=UPI0024171DDC|nr:cupin domain-containing protein [Micromonospora sp. WMMD980]MDG4803688.1 cupin domain-containing protein [Micromonospora sp. WMMD980]